MQIGDRYIDPTARLNVPFRPLQGFVPSTKGHSTEPVPLPNKVYIGPFCVIGEDTRLGERVIIDEFCKIGRACIIGDDTLIVYRSNIGAGAQIGANCVIGGVISENCRVGTNCKIFGKVIHKHLNSLASWDHSEPEESVKIHDMSFVGFDAILAGRINIGPRAYVCAGSIITRDVPPLHIAYETNKIIHFEAWKGPLRTNPVFHAPG